MRLAFLSLLALLAQAADPTLLIQGLDNTTVTLTAADIAALPAQTIQTQDHGKPASFEGVPLSELLRKVQLPLGEKYHSTAASYYLQVEAADGYRAVYAWAELDPSFLDKPLFLVTRRDGKPLPANAGPYQLVAPGEKRGARWVRQVTALRVRRAQ
jgi:hypothetical protein